MSQEELINTISERAGISKQTVREIISAFSDVWTEEILMNGELTLDNIGDFLVEHRPGRQGVNTETREIFSIPPRDYIAFQPAQDLINWSNKSS
jgi:nucleoid DNA-binding protein